MPGMQRKPSDYERELLERSKGSKEKLMRILLNDFMLHKRECEELLKKVNGVCEAWDAQREKVADYLLNL